MNVDRILDTFNRHGVAYLLIGGMNFLLRHEPVLTYDVDLWIEDSAENRRRCEMALAALDAEWGRTDAHCGPVETLPPGWLDQQALYCLNSPHGAIDIFRSVRGLADWQTAWQSSVAEQTSAGTNYHGLDDADMPMSTGARPSHAKEESNRHFAIETEVKPMNEPQADLVAAEEAKRERNWDPRQRWQVIQETITWADSQRSVRRNTPAACLAEQQRKLSELASKP